VAGIGARLAAQSERPDLPWSFKVVDDPTVNAFALPGGFIYITRGILTHLTDEAELASVLGHEIGHVTGRHSVERISKAQLAGIGLGIGAVLSPELRDFGDLAQMGLGLLFLKYSRDDERQADELGLRYLLRGRYDPRRMAEVFALLGRVGEAGGGGRIPNWLATHPAPEDRYQRIAGEVAGLGDLGEARVGRDAYLARIDGMVFGDDPREGYFDGATFHHPALAFRLRLPDGWKTSNRRQAVGAVAPGEDAQVVLTLSGGASPAAAAQAFFAQQGIERGESWRPGIRGLAVEAGYFSAPREQGEDLVGAAAFVALGERVFQLLGVTLRSRWSSYDRAIAGAIASFARETDPKVLAVQPKRVKVVKLPGAMTLGEFARRYPSTVDLETLALINQVEGAEARLAAGAEVKRVVGGELP
jgi:predicted Zn-dependent protease